MNIHIGNYEVGSVILDLGSDVSILRNQTWQSMGKPTLGWSLVQLWLENPVTVHPIGLWKLNPSDRTIALTKLLIKHAKFTQKETEIGE